MKAPFGTVAASDEPNRPGRALQKHDGVKTSSESEADRPGTGSANELKED